MIDVKAFDGYDLPEWIDDEAAKTICSFLNSILHERGLGKLGVRFHSLNHYVKPTLDSEPKPRLYLHCVNAAAIPDTPQQDLYNKVMRWYVESRLASRIPDARKRHEILERRKDL